MADASGYSIWLDWHLHPDVVIGLAALLAVYLYAVGPMRARLGIAETIEPRRVVMFTAGIVVIFVALNSPLHELSNDYLFSAHMIQHVLLTLAVPPLLISGTPGWVLRPLLRHKAVRVPARALTHPLVGFAAFNLMFSLWHFPALYAGSVDFHGIHIAEHILFLATGVMGWWPLMSNSAELPRLSEPVQMIYLLFMSIAQIFVFAPITFAGQPIYEHYVNAPVIWGISDIADQQAGGLIMKVGGGMVFMSLLIVTFFRWHSREQRAGKTQVGRADVGTRRVDAEHSTG